MGKGRACCWLHIQLKKELIVSKDTLRISYTSTSHSTTHRGPLFPLYSSFNSSWFAMFLGNFKQNLKETRTKCFSTHYCTLSALTHMSTVMFLSLNLHTCPGTTYEKRRPICVDYWSFLPLKLYIIAVIFIKRLQRTLEQNSDFHLQLWIRILISVPTAGDFLLQLKRCLSP